MGDEEWMPSLLNKEQTDPKCVPSLRDNSDATTSATSDNVLKLNDLLVQEEDKCQVSDNADLKKKATRIVGWGLRKFSVIVCRKVEAKGRTTYNEVADEIIADLASLDKNTAPEFAFDEKNIRRRVYDAFNVLMAINVIEKDKKEIRWVGFPATKTDEINELKEMQMDLMSRIQAKASFLKELEEKFVDLQNLMLRNQQLHKSGKIPSEGVALPFLLVQTHPQATVEIAISEDRCFVQFDFNGTPFSLHDNASILKAMRCPQQEPKHATQISSDSSSLVADHRGHVPEPISFPWNSGN